MAMRFGRINRREFVKVAGLSAAALVVSRRAAHGKTDETQAGTNVPADAKAPFPRVPTRRFGRTGVEVPMLALGGIFDVPSNQLVLEQAYAHGVTYWDTAYSYGGGRSEQGMGAFFERYPERRKHIFVVTKTGARDPQGMSAQLNESLQRLKTDYVDLYFLHGISDPRGLTDRIREWAEQAKKDKKIRFFGFSTHANMEMCLEGAAKLGWIDGVMLTYNYRIMNTDRMKAAVEAAAKAGIGLTAMKTQAAPARRQSGQAGGEPDAADALLEHFSRRGFTPQQAKLKMVWETAEIASICSAMYTVSVLKANVAAALDKTQLTEADGQALWAEAVASRAAYCAGCTRLCEAVVGSRVPIGDILRSVMYAHSYGDLALARQTLEEAGCASWAELGGVDLAAAEGRCPNGLPIAQLVREAATLLA